MKQPSKIPHLALLPILLATTDSVQNAIFAGVILVLVVLFSQAALLPMHKYVPQGAQFAALLITAAGFTTLAAMLLQTYFPEISQSLGIYTPLIALAAVPLLNQKSPQGFLPPLFSLLFSLFSLITLATTREILGAGTFAGIPLFGENFQPALIMILPAGAFITLGLFLGFVKPRKGGSL